MMSKLKKVAFLFMCILFIFPINISAQTEGKNDVKLFYRGIDYYDTKEDMGNKIYFGTSAQYQKDKENAISAEEFTLLMINGSFIKNFNVPIREGIAYLPITIFEEKLHVQINRDKENQKIEMIKDGNKIVLDLKKYSIFINNGNTKIEKSMKYINGKIYVPAKKIAENLGFTAGYNRSLLYTANTDNGDEYLPIVWIEEKNQNLKVFSKEEAADILKNFLYDEIRNDEFIRERINETNASKKYYTDIIESAQCADGFGRYYFVESTLFYDGAYHKKSGLGNDLFIDKYTGIIYEVRSLTSGLVSFEIMIGEECKPLQYFFVG